MCLALKPGLPVLYHLTAYVAIKVRCVMCGGMVLDGQTYSSVLTLPATSLSDLGQVSGPHKIASSAIVMVW